MEDRKKEGAGSDAKSAWIRRRKALEPNVATPIRAKAAAKAAGRRRKESDRDEVRRAR